MAFFREGLNSFMIKSSYNWTYVSTTDRVYQVWAVSISPVNYNWLLYYIRIYILMCCVSERAVKFRENKILSYRVAVIIYFFFLFTCHTIIKLHFSEAVNIEMFRPWAGRTSVDSYILYVSLFCSYLSGFWWSILAGSQNTAQMSSEAPDSE